MSPDSSAGVRHRIAIGSDRDGQPVKEKLIGLLREERHSAKDCRLRKADPAEAPDIVALVAKSVLAGEAELGIVVSDSGAVASMLANKIPGIRACHCQDTVSARHVRRSADANILCLGSRVLGDDLAAEIARVFVDSVRSADTRHDRVRRKILEAEESFEGRREALLAQAEAAN